LRTSIHLTKKREEKTKRKRNLERRKFQNEGNQ
jgi:hypothetical protein